MSQQLLLTMHECVRVNEQLQKGIANSRSTDLLDILAALQASDIKGKLKFIAESKLGLTVNKLTKHTDEEIKAAAARLKKAWAAVAQQAKATKPAEAKSEPALPPPAPMEEVKASKSVIQDDDDNDEPAIPELAEWSSSSAAPVPLIASSSLSVSMPKRPPATTGDSRRDMVRGKLQECFELGKEANESYLREQYVDTAQLAECAENGMYVVFGGTDYDYRARFRSLMFNLKDKKNPEFVRVVMTGQLHIDELATMEVHDMASDAMKKERTQWQAAFKKAAHQGKPFHEDQCAPFWSTDEVQTSFYSRENALFQRAPWKSMD